MKRILYILLLMLFDVSLCMAQSFKVRECTEDEIPSSKRADYYKEARRIIENHYMLLLESVGDSDNREVIIEQMISDKRASKLKTEFLLTQDNNLSFCSPQQYFTKFEYIYKDLVDKVNFKVDNFKDGKIMMNSLVSCYIPVDYDLTLMNGDQILFKRQCRMYCLFPKATASKLVKVMQVEPIKNIIFQTTFNNTKSDTKYNEYYTSIKKYFSRKWLEFLDGGDDDWMAFGFFILGIIGYFIVIIGYMHDEIAEGNCKGLYACIKIFLKVSLLYTLIYYLPITLFVFFFGGEGAALYPLIIVAGIFLFFMICDGKPKFHGVAATWGLWLVGILFIGIIICIIYLMVTNQL
ncbi:MAG: hypothetical protein IKY67_12585 [Paludibacteraceae bacterium]|nr:hypothetical protein [Paludibacteraceae bacterium]